MAGEDGQGYQEDPQQRATQEVTASQEAVDASSKASYSLSSAQTSSAWTGPRPLGVRRARCSTVSPMSCRRRTR